MDEVKAARERLSGVWTVGYVEDNWRERLVNDVHTLLSDHARLTAEVERLATPGPLEPQGVEVREAVEYYAKQYMGGCTEADLHLGTLLHAVQSPRLTGHPDDVAVDLFSAAMKEKLAAKRAEGRGGWNDPDKCSIGFLVSLLHGHIQKGDPVDIANIAMMLWSRGLRGNGSVPAPRRVPRTRGRKLIQDHTRGRCEVETVQQEIERLQAKDDNSWCSRRYYIWSLWNLCGGDLWFSYGEAEDWMWQILFEEMTTPRINY